MNLTPKFALIAGAIVLSTCIGLGLHGADRARGDVIEAAERYNVTLARMLANAIWERHGDMLRSDRPRETGDPRLALVDAETHRLLQGLPVGKIKLYARDGMTLYSTAHGDIGVDKSDNAGYRVALAGGVNSALHFKDTFNAFDRELTERDVLETYVAIRGDGGVIEGVMEVYHDLTPILAHMRRAQLESWAVTGAAMATVLALLVLFVWRSEAAMRRARAVADEAQLRERMKSEFLANVSHELRSPMNAILGFAQVIQNGVFGPLRPERYESYVNDIVDSGAYLLRTIDDILDMARIEAKQVELVPTTVDLSDLLHRCTRQIGQAYRRADVELAVEAPAAPIYLRVDENRLRQAICNVLGNGVKFIHGAGKVTVGAVRRRNGDVVVSIRDTGIGIAPDKIADILTPFGQVAGAYTRNVGGIGLGLPIAKALVELHDGGLDIDSEVGVGTTVTLTLPAARVIPANDAEDAMRAA